jgi:hypothetical protein
MFDMMPMLRKRNIFGNQPEPTEDTTSNPFSGVSFNGDTSRTSETGPDTNPFGDAYGRIMSADDGPAQKNFRDVLSQAPNRADYNPNKKQRLASILSGVAAGAQGKDGYGAARNTLDAPYNQAMGDYNNRASLAKLGADEEEKNITNRRQIYRDILADEDKRRNDARQDRLADSTVTYNDARTRNLNGPKAPTNAYTNKLDGHRYAIQPDPSNPKGYSILDLGAADETPGQRDSREVNKFRQTSGITAANQKSVFDYEEPKRQTNRLGAQDHANDLTMKRQTARMDRQQAERDAADANNPNRQYARRTMAFIDVMDARKDLADKINKNDDTGVWESDDPEVLDLVAARLKPKSTKPSSRIVQP